MLFDYYFFTIHDINALLRSVEALSIEVIDGSVLLTVGSDVDGVNTRGLFLFFMLYFVLNCLTL